METNNPFKGSTLGLGEIWNEARQARHGELSPRVRVYAIYLPPCTRKCVLKVMGKKVERSDIYAFGDV